MYSKAISYLLTREKVTTEELYFFLKEQRLLSLLPQILSELKERKREGELQEMVTIASPFIMSESSTSIVKELILAPPHTKVKLEIDKELLSGFRATYLNRSYDSSARAIINELIQ